MSIFKSTKYYCPLTTSFDTRTRSMLSNIAYEAAFWLVVFQLVTILAVIVYTHRCQRGLWAISNKFKTNCVLLFMLCVVGIPWVLCCCIGIIILSTHTQLMILLIANDCFLILRPILIKKYVVVGLKDRKAALKTNEQRRRDATSFILLQNRWASPSVNSQPSSTS
eukprot:GHVR01087070.1.p1 GENE.GHVR01087070.1~~GHVR01087070.1.p1  ORF type:complete len:181 (-),score=45.76 GHVR01087070.1:266-763(-)